MPPTASTVADRSRIIWRMRLHSALRTAVACAIVGGATIFGPGVLVNQIKFSAFSYLTAVLIVSDASLGDTLKGCWHALCASAQVVPLGVFWRWIIGPTAARLPVSVAAAVVTVASFLVALPECTHLTAKRIAFGQIVLVWTTSYVVGKDDDGFMHPVHVAASTALGALASVLALLIPYPSLACDKAHKLCQVYAENASQRMNIYLRAFSTQDDRTKMELISQAKPLDEIGAKLLQSIRILQEGMQWEKPWSRHWIPNLDRLKNMERQMRGIEYSLVPSSAFPVQVVEQEQLSNVLQGISIQLEQQIEQVGCFSPLTEPAKRGEFMGKLSLPLEIMSPIRNKHEWVFFCLSCIDMLLNDAADSGATRRELKTQHSKTEFIGIIRTFNTWIQKLTSSGRLEFAFKCSLSLGLAVLFGLIFDKENGCWAGLVIAISFVTGRQAGFTLANTRAQGTAIGSVYGVICCFLFHLKTIRLLALLPWIIFSSFLRYSRMYGQTGGVSAAIAASLILGRKNYGTPNDFALARLTEVFIGLSAFIVVELFLQATRAATLAKNHLNLTLCSLQDCIKETRICLTKKNKTVPKFLELREKQRNLNHLVDELKKFIADAELEPDLWYLPFRTSWYQKLVGSLSNIVDLLYFITYNFEILLDSETTAADKEFQEQMNSELELFQETLSSCSSKIYPEKAHSSDSQAESKEPMDEDFRDLVPGNLNNPGDLSIFITGPEEAERTIEVEDSEHNKRVRERMIQYLGATRFCISSLDKEIDEIQISKREIDLWENNLSQ